jgi:predicted MarR family transcription regulator
MINTDTLLTGLISRVQSLKDAEILILDSLELMDNNDEKDVALVAVLKDLRFCIRSLTKLKDEGFIKKTEDAAKERLQALYQEEGGAV